MQTHAGKSGKRQCSGSSTAFWAWIMQIREGLVFPGLLPAFFQPLGFCKSWMQVRPEVRSNPYTVSPMVVPWSMLCFSKSSVGFWKSLVCEFVVLCFIHVSIKAVQAQGSSFLVLKDLGRGPENNFQQTSSTAEVTLDFSAIKPWISSLWFIQGRLWSELRNPI